MQQASVIEKPIKMADPRFDRTVLDDISQILESGKLRSGQWTERFEEVFATRMDADCACAVSSGTAALHIALESSVEKGTEVMVPAFSFFASASTIIHAQCTPVFVDVNPDTFLMDLDDLMNKIGPKTSAILPVNLFGNIVDPERVSEIAEEQDLRVIYDSAQSTGSTFRGWESGALGDMSCFSFYLSKVITTGEGGMVTTNDASLDKITKFLRNHGETDQYLHERLGFNYRSTEIASALGLSQMRKLDRYIQRRKSIAMYYDLAFRNIEGLTPQRITENVESSYNYYTVKLDSEILECSNDDLQRDLKLEKIETGIYYPLPLDRQPVLEKYSTAPCPVANMLSFQVISIPIHSGLNSKDTERVVQTLRKVTESYLI